MKQHAIIPHSRPCVGGAEIKAVTSVIRSGQLAGGPHVAILEKTLSHLAAQRHGIAVSSGTAALYLSLRAMGIGPRESVVIPSYACTALLNAVVACGAKPVLADIDPSNGLLTSDTVKKALRRNTAAVIVPHLFGFMADVPNIAALGVPVIEDCAQCVGTTRDGKNAGATGLAATFSFYATKLIGAGEGGLVATSDQLLAGRVRELCEYDNRNTWTPGFNYKLSDLHAAVAVAQLDKLNNMIRRRRSIARAYTAAFEKAGAPVLPIRIPHQTDPVFFRFVVLTPQDPDTLIAVMEKNRVACRRPVFKPLHRYLDIAGFPGTNEFYSRALSLPVYPDLGIALATAIARKLINAL